MPMHRYPGGIIVADSVTPGQNLASGVWTLEAQMQANGTGFWPQSSSLMSRSLRFNSPDSAYLTRTPTVAGNTKTWTWSGWIKRSKLAASQEILFNAGTYNPQIQLENDYLNIYATSGATCSVGTNQVFRDVSAWYHIVFSVDTTQVTASNRIKIYVNGSQVTALSSFDGSGAAVYPSQNYQFDINNTISHQIGGRLGSSIYFNGYMTEVILVDGQALDASSFGYTDSNNVWQPKPYVGSVGINGFYLTFSDNSSVTSTTLGRDYSSQGNNWTPVNFSVTAGAGNDSLVDVPTNWGTDTGLGGEVRGNYATLNPLDRDTAYTAIKNGNLDSEVSGYKCVVGTLAVTSGKWYWEVTATGTSAGPASQMIGIADANGALSTKTWQGANGWYYYTNGSKYNNNGSASYGATFTTNDVIGIALDMDAGTVTFYKNGSSQGQAYSGLTGKAIQPALSDGSSAYYQYCSSNFGQRPFAYTAPSGFKALCTQNLTTPTIQNGGLYFNATLWTGNGSTQSITNSGFQPDFVWSKSRVAANSHKLYDSVRGVYKALYSNSTNAEANDSPYGVTAFNSSGFSVSDTANGDYGVNGGAGGTYSGTPPNYVGWNWKAGGAGVSNTSGSITSTVSANTTSGFSIVTYTGTGANATVGHGLGVAPSMVIIKSRSNGSAWAVGSSFLTSWSYYMYLNSTAAQTLAASLFNGTAPTSSVFSVGTDTDTNGSTRTYVAYCFAPVAGYSAFGSFVGNGSADGPFIYLGFRPRYVLIKKTNSTSDWLLTDSSRDPYNAVNHELDAELSSAETTGFNFFDYLSNGFKNRATNAAWNNNNDTYIYAAFAENPFKIARAR